MNVHDAARIEQFYNPDSDIAVGPSGQLINVTWAEYALLQMIVDQQKEIYAQQERVDALERQVAQLVEDNPRTREKQPLPPNWAENIMAQDARRVERHRRDFKEVARMEGKTIAQVERDLCKRDKSCHS